MSLITRPLLAVAATDIEQLMYPIFVTPKIDGIRCLIVDGKAVTRNFKPQPNVHVRTTLENIFKDISVSLDGELVLANGASFNDVQSEIMSFDGEPKFEYHIFDLVDSDLTEPYTQRLDKLFSLYQERYSNNPKIKLIFPEKIENVEALSAYETLCLTAGYEGVMIRRGDGKYKCGRSTLKEGVLLKLKRFTDAEAIVLGFEEKLHNNNEKEKDAFGLSKRSSCKDNLVPAGTLGNLLVKDIKTNIEFSIGSGFDDATRKKIWENQPIYLNQLVKYKAQAFGAKEKPRFPVFLGFRSPEDL